MQEKGRSMVEMLGVLAIIGVLSVGAMSGYSKAMLKYKLNRQAEAMTILLNNAMQLRPPLKQNSSPNDENYSIVYTELLHKLNLLPDGIRLSANNNKYMEDMFDNFILFFPKALIMPSVIFLLTAQGAMATERIALKFAAILFMFSNLTVHC